MTAKIKVRYWVMGKKGRAWIGVSDIADITLTGARKTMRDNKYDYSRVVILKYIEEVE